MRKRNYNQYLIESGLTEAEVQKLRVTDFEFEYIDKRNIEKCSEITAFIKRHEWLGKMPTRPTHRFIASYKGKLAGVIVMSTPNAFSNLLGKETRDLEKLISRGACISWSPKNLASSLIMFSLRWMVQNTPFRFFTAYSDVEAKELGTIYQACNFTYLGQSSGARHEYLDPEQPEKGWFADRQFRKTSQTKRYAKELGIEWLKGWSSGDQVHWPRIPIEIKKRIEEHKWQHVYRCQRRVLKKKHKYVYILGRDKRETLKLRKIFDERNPHYVGIPYPKIRGADIDTAAHLRKLMEDRLTKYPDEYRPQEEPQKYELPERKYVFPKEVAAYMGVSEWTIYNLIKNPRGFPVLNVGLKKKYVIDREKFFQWLEARYQSRSEECQT